MTGLRTLSIGICLIACTASVIAADKSRVVGYLPEYRVGSIDPAIGKHLTDVVFFSIDPQPGKPLRHPQWEMAKPLLMAWKKEHGVHITITLGGWNRSSGFPKIAATEDSRRAFAENVLKLCREHELNGVDLDWEHPKDAREEADYAALIIELKRVLKPHGLTVTAAVAGWQRLSPAGWQALDAVHLMAYDGPKQHSTYESAVVDVQRLLDAGVRPEQIRLGLPFYGRGVVARDKVLTYAEIVKGYSPAPDVNEVDGVYFNGPEMCRRKCAFAAEKKLGGVMVWEIGQDAPGDASLLRTIHDFRP